MKMIVLARGLSAGLGRWRAPRAVRDPSKIVADLADVREGYRLENRPLVGAQRDPHPLQWLGRSRVCHVLRPLAADAEQLAVDRADDIGQRDLRGRPGQPEPAVRPALAAHDVAAPQVGQDRPEELAWMFCA
jgi:hypothetical protein